jgi:type II secretory pathway predicted ATPase ExeA
MSGSGNGAARWLSHFGLRESPFSKEISDAELWLPTSRKAVVEELVEACHDRAHVLLTGEPGVGKTCVLRAVRHRLPEQGYRLTYCHNATLGRRDFYRQLCLALGLSPRATAAAVFYAISSHVQDLGSQRLHPVFLLDEAHLLHQEVLEHLHILANYEWDSRALLSLVLVGLPELREQLSLRKNRSFWSRIHVRLDLGEARSQDSVEYVHYRLERAGADREIFSSDALSMLHEASGGRLREIDRVATDALKLAARKKLRLLDRELITRVLDDVAPRDDR